MSRPALEASLRSARDSGRKLLLPYMTGGFGDNWLEVVRAYAAAGADAIEIGIPFSDPVMDGPTIQEASERALRAGATPMGVLRALADLDVEVPLVAMTYYNLAFHAGHERFAQSLRETGVGGCILPDLPLEESGPWCAAADDAGVATVMLAAPTAPDDRLPRICARARGFVYAVGLVGVTGERATLAASTTVMAKRLKAVTDVPVVSGIGISTPQQAAEACAEADGVVMASAIIRLLLDGGGPDEAGAFVAEVRAAIDSRGSVSAVACELCEAAKITEWFYEDDVCWIAECEICAVPMVVWREHDALPSDEVKAVLHERLAAVVTQHFEFDHYVDDHMRNIPDHYHAHARPRGGFFGHGLKRRDPQG